MAAALARMAVADRPLRAHRRAGGQVRHHRGLRPGRGPGLRGGRAPGGATAGPGRGPGPADHPRRRPGRVPRGPRPAAGLQAPGQLRGGRRGLDRHPGHPRRAGPGQGQAARAGRGGRPDRGRRPGHRARHHLPHLGQRPGQCRPGRPAAHPGRRRGRAPGRPLPVPGDPGHPARGHAGERDHRVGLHAGGQGGRAARARSSSTPPIPCPGVWSGRRRRRRPGRPTSTPLTSTALEAGPPLPAGAPRHLGRADRAPGPRPPPAPAPGPQRGGRDDRPGRDRTAGHRVWPDGHRRAGARGPRRTP